MRLKHTTRSMLLGILCALAIAFSGTLLHAPAPAQAVNANEFNPGNIISDALYYDGNALSAAGVQTFLNQQVSRCTIGDPGRGAGSPAAGSTVATACLKDARFSTASRAANAYCQTYPGSPNESAADIIAKVGRACGISQKVLLVMLEKEQSLVTDTWPTVRQYNVAMGYACPDSGPNNSANCDPSQTGFMQQVYRAAWQIKVYKANPDNYNYRPGWNTIQWHPNAACGTSQVYIENWATASLYIYTPYRPNAAALNAGWGTGDACSTYGNRNFFLFYTTWFGATQPVNHSAFDSATGGYGGIRVSGWARNVSSPGSTAYIWANVYNSGGALVASQAIAANQPLSWFDSMFPGSGNNHGFNAVVNVPPGSYRVELFNSSMNSDFIGAKTATVPIGQGHVDSVSQAVKGIRIQGWSVDFRKTSADSIKVVLDGKQVSQQFPADKATNWIDGMFPGMGNNHAFDFTVPASNGKHTVCVYGASGLLAPCATTTVSDIEHGSLDSVTAVEGGVRVTGWAMSMGTSSPLPVAITVNGSRTTIQADKPLSWFDAMFPGAGLNHGFDAVVPVSQAGTYEFCVISTKTGKKLGCKTQYVLVGEGAAFDSATGVIGGIRITGWAARFGSPASSFIWVNVDGSGSPYRADLPLSWFNGYSPGSGPNHGYDLTIPAAPGAHQVCVFGASTGISAGCKQVTVPSPREQGHLDGVAGEPGAIHVWGWSHILGQPERSWVWIDVDGTGKAYPADTELSWFNGFAPGQGNKHGFDVRIPATPGTHRVCVSGSNGPTAYGCQVVTTN